MESKKETKAQLERRIKSALIFVPKDKNYLGVYFSDKGLHLEATDDFVVISTGFHKHVFYASTSSGTSRPYMYTKLFIEIALTHDCTVEDSKNGKSHSYSKLMETLRKKENESDYLIAFYVDMWLQNIFSPLYMLDNTEGASFMTYLDYCSVLARNVVLLSEHKKDVTNKQFIRAYTKKIHELTDDNVERVILKKKTDEERMQEEIAALAEMEAENDIETKIKSELDGNKDKETK